MLGVIPTETQKGTREKSRTLGTRTWAIGWQWHFTQIKIYRMHILRLRVTLSFLLSTAPLEQDLTTMTVPSRHQQNAQEGSKNTKSKPTTGLGNFSIQRKHFTGHPFLAASPTFPDPEPSVQVQPPSSSTSTPRLGFGELFHFWGPQMNSAILCCIVSHSNISLSILSPATRTSKHRN